CLGGTLILPNFYHPGRVPILATALAQTRLICLWKASPVCIVTPKQSYCETISIGEPLMWKWSSLARCPPRLNLIILVLDWLRAILFVSHHLINLMMASLSWSADSE